MKHKTACILNNLKNSGILKINSILFITSLLIIQSNSLLGSTSSRRNNVVIAIEKAGQAVVSLSAENLVTQKYLDPLFGFRSEMFNDFFNDYFGTFKEKRVEMPLGSGVIIDEDGYIVTNEHVISRASIVKVTFTDGAMLNAHLISTDPVNDLAILKVDSPSPLPSIKMGKSNDLMIGETVIAIGNPFGLGYSVTTGVLSATNRSLNFGKGDLNIEYKNLIQTDALINPGNSGGALLNIDGELIGINTAILTKGQGIGFAIPVDKVKKTLVKLLNFREINKVWIGIEVEDSNSSLGGIVVTDIEEDSPAKKSGLKNGDIISQIDEAAINDVFEYEKYILKKKENDTIAITLFRDKTNKKVTVTISKAPNLSPEKLAAKKLGIIVQPLTMDIAKRLGFMASRNGALVTGVEKDSPADIVKILPGYVIMSLGPYRITNLEELGTVLSKAHSDEVVDVGLIWTDSYGEHRGYASLKIR